MVTMARADPPRRKVFSGFLSRSGTDNPLRGGFEAPTGSTLSLPLSRVESSKEELKGPIGLTTLREPPPPESPIADIIFVHGLGGGSRKTWSYSYEPQHYWPRSWLSADKEFTGVRIHVFGYRADWSERRESTLDIHDFGQSLLGALLNHPNIRRACSRIILVGHSMGGCVAKKAYILARQDPAAADIARRIHSMFFLATPHRGSDMAAILENMLMVGWGKKPFVADLTPNSAALTAINDTFRHFAPELRLWSFFETLPMRSSGFTSRIVVDRHSATLGYPKEEIAAMDADHRQVCKFESVADPNYKLLRNALVTAIDLIRAAAESEPGQPAKPALSPREARSLLSSFLGAQDAPEGDLANLQALEQPGSCQWLTRKESFISWRSGTAPGILWLLGRPGAGKSILASHVVEELRSSGAYCSYFIFKHGKNTSILHHCFRSLAFQMALHDDAVKEAILQLAQEGNIPWHEMDDASVWRRLFPNCILKIPSVMQHYWVLDGVDECLGFNGLFTKRIFANLPSGFRLFGTSRGLEAIERGIASLGPAWSNTEVLSDADTVEDIRLLVTTQLTELGRLETPEDLERMCQRIVSKSSGSFLWTRLVLQGFEEVWTEEAMDAVLRDTPAELFDVYSRMVQSIEKDKHRAALGKCTLTWVLLACRPFTVDELRSAIKLDTGQTLKNATKAIPDICGQLVFVDQHDKVHLIHDTVREFLLVANDFGLAVFVDEGQSHTRLASLLLAYLCGDALKGLSVGFRTSLVRGPSRGFANTKTLGAAKQVDASLLDYACTFFSEHVYLANTGDIQLMDDICNFFQSDNTLSWIEHVATSGNLQPLVRTAENLHGYLDRRTGYLPTRDGMVRLLRDWAMDIIRLVAKFGKELLSCPFSIHRLIPPLCPTESMISRISCGAVHSLSAPKLTVRGFQPGPWDDCLARMDYPKGRALTVKYAADFFAVGLSTGQIFLYDASSFQVRQQLKHPDGVRLLESSQDDRLLASCSARTLVIWDTETGAMLHSFPLQSRPLAVIFLGIDEILGASERCELTKWSLTTGEHESISWADIGADTGDQPTVPLSRPCRAAFLDTEDEVFLALAYQDAPIFIWSALELQVLGTVGHEMIPTAGIDSMVFHPNAEIPVVLVSYQPGVLCVFDYRTMELRARRGHVYATTIACSLDARSVVVGTATGSIEVFNFVYNSANRVTLAPIYRSKEPLDDTIRSISFSSHGFRFVDVRSRQARVWAPTGLVRRRANEADEALHGTDIGDEEEIPVLPKTNAPTAFGQLKITSPLVACGDGRFILAGKSNGDVVLFSTADATEVGVIYRHTGKSSVLALALHESRNLVVSANDAGRALVAELETPFKEVGMTTRLPRVQIIFDHVITSGAIVSLLINRTGDRLHIQGNLVHELWALPSGAVSRVEDHAEPNADHLGAGLLSPPRPTMVSLTGTSNAKVREGVSELGSAFQHPTNTDWFVRVTGDIARIYSWTDFSEHNRLEGIYLARDPLQSSPECNGTGRTVHSPTVPKASYHVGPDFVVEFFQASHLSARRVSLWPSTAFDRASKAVVARPTVEPDLETISATAIAVLGMVDSSTVLFLDADLWVCSVDLQSKAVPPPPSRRGFTRNATAKVAESRPPIRRHFFALTEWRTSSGDLRCTVAVPPTPAGVGGARRQDIVAFAVQDRIVVFHGGLQFSDGDVASPRRVGTRCWGAAD